MLKFEKFTKENLKEYLKYIKDSPLKCNDVSVGSFLMYNESVNLQFAVINETFISRQDICGDVVFSFPFGKDENGAIDQLIEYVKQNDLPLVFYGVDDLLFEKIKTNPKFSSVQGNYDRRWSDYFYDFNEMRYFSGGKFSGQRNHINRFLKTYGIPIFSKIDKEDIPKIKEFLKEYTKEHEERALNENEELLGTFALLESFNDYNLIGAKLQVNGEIVGFAIGEIIGDTLIIHVEKAIKSYLGSYPTLFNYFVSFVAENFGNDLKYVNREDDSGDIGLRTSKLQYKPLFLVNKNLVKINSPLLSIEENPKIYGDGIYLDKIKEEDKPNYFSLCKDEEINKLWGYDYKEDSSITGEINENTFYDVQKYDNSLGYSINFAIRESENGELLGETIVYNFTYNKNAEMGCRLLKKAWGKKLGAKAYRLTLEWAEKTLGVSITGKCFKENLPSIKMITSSGLELFSSDDKYFYFKRKTVDNQLTARLK